MRLITAVIAAAMLAAACKNSPTGGHATPVGTRDRGQTSVAETETATPPAPYAVVDGFQAALANATFYLATGFQPGYTVDGIESVSYVETTIAAAESVLGDAATREQPVDHPWPPETRAWLFFERGQFGEVSMHGGFHGQEGWLWVLAPQGFLAIYAMAPYADLSRLGEPVVIAKGEVPQIDRKRVPEDYVVQSFADAVAAVARLFPQLDARVESIDVASTTVGSAASLTGISLSGLASPTPAWVFDAAGDFELYCGGDIRIGEARIRLLVVAGSAAPFVVPSIESLHTTPMPTPALSKFGDSASVKPGQWPAIDAFRESSAQIDSAETVLAATPVVPCAGTR